MIQIHATSGWLSYFYIPQAMNIIKNLFNKPTHKQIAERTLEEYQRALLAAQAEASFQAKLVEYYTEGISRLQRAVK